MNTEAKDWAAPFRFFEWVSSIPRKSHDEKQISDALVAFANERGLYVEQDEALNVLIRKSGSPGREDEMPVILQAHMDMVFETEDEGKHPYGNPLKLVWLMMKRLYRQRGRRWAQMTASGWRSFWRFWMISL